MKGKPVGPQDLPQFEDRVLYHLVDLAGDMPIGELGGINEAELITPLAGELGVSTDFGRNEH